MVTIFTKNNPEQCSNYRPVSLLCIASKLLEKVVCNRVYDSVLPRILVANMDSQKATQPHLFVFRSLDASLESSIQTNKINLDFTKAFDSVPPNLTLLLHKRPPFGISGNLLAWFN